MAALILVALLVLNSALLVAPPAWHAELFFLIVISPGVLLGWWYLGANLTRAERLALGIALGFAWALLSAYCALPCAVPQSAHTGVVLYCLSNQLSAGFILAAPRREFSRSSSGELWVLLLLIGLSAFLRFYELGRSEFQGDEARAALLAERVHVEGGAVLFTHKKGPAEIVLPWIMRSKWLPLNEFSARFPFALAGIGVVLLIYCIALRVSGSLLAAALAGFMSSCEGFLVAFSRILQYQSVLLLFVSAAFLLALCYREKAPRGLGTLFCIAVLCGCACLSHYDAALVLPAVLLLVLSFDRAEMTKLLLAGLSFVLLLASFYVPFFLGENFGGTSGYLWERLRLDRFPSNNLWRYIELASFYNSSYLVAVWLGALCLALTQVRRLKDLAPCYRALLLWFVLGFGVMAFVVYRPNTHFYIAYPAQLILVSVVLAWTLRSSRITALCASGAICLVALLQINYVRLAYLTFKPELRFALHSALPWYYYRPYGDAPPGGAFFGFPRVSGWSKVRELYASGALSGTFDSNEEELITSWYLCSAKRAPDPDYYILASNPNDPLELPRRRIEREYAFWGRVYVDDERRIDIYSRTPPQAGPQRFDL